MNKKALEISFKLILSIVVGAIILAFFINFAFQHMRTSEALTSSKLANNLELQLDILGVSLSAFKEFDILDNKLEFNCNDITITSGKEFFRNPTDKIIVANAEITKKFKVLSLAWEFPFKITNFYYASNKPLYIEDSKIKEKLKSFTFTNNPSEAALPVFIKNPTKKSILVQGNTITFYPENKQVIYESDEILLLAIFSKDFNQFNCLKQKAVEKLKFIASLYQKKAAYLRSKTSPNCALSYSQLINSLESFKTNLDKGVIETQNKELRNNNCPTLY